MKAKVYENLDEISVKITNASVPTEKDKEKLMYMLNRQLNESEHLDLFMQFLQNLPKRIYTITENCTLFDLNDLNPETFWKIYSYTVLCIQNHDRQKEMIKVDRECAEKSDQLRNKMSADLIQFQKDPNHAKADDLTTLSPYEKMRVQALSQCSYSTYAIPSNDFPSMSLVDDKCLEKTTYSDNFRNRWSETGPLASETRSSVLDTIPKEIPSKSIEHLDDENDDLIDFDDEAEKTETRSSVSELDRLKSQLGRMPKLTLKTGPITYDDMEEQD